MATKKQADSGSGSGGGGGSGSGSGSGESGTAMDLEDLLPVLASNTGNLQQTVKVSRADSDGRVPGGARLGSMSLHPLANLDDRVIEEWGGPATYWLAFRCTDGTLFRWARLRVGPTPHRPAPGATAAPAPVAAPAAPAPSPLSVLRELHEVGLLHAPGAPAAPVAPRTLTEQVGDLTAGLGALEAAGLATRKREGDSNATVAIVREVLPSAEKLLGSVLELVGGVVEAHRQSNKTKAAEAELRLEVARRRPAPAPVATTEGGADAGG